MAEKKTISDKVETTEKRVVKVDTPVETILQWNQDEGVVLVWDHSSFAELSDDVVSELRHKNRDNYYIAKGAYNVIKGDADKVVEEGRISMSSPLMDTLGYHTKRLQIRKRQGFHQCWKRPDEIEYAKAAGYVVVRDLSEDQKKAGKPVEPGRENGEIKKLKRSTRSGNVVDESVAMEVPMELYEKHLKAVSAMSKQRYRSIKDTFRAEAERVNSKFGGKGRYVDVV